MATKQTLSTAIPLGFLEVNDLISLFLFPFAHQNEDTTLVFLSLTAPKIMATLLPLKIAQHQKQPLLKSAAAFSQILFPYVESLISVQRILSSFFFNVVL